MNEEFWKVWRWYSLWALIGTLFFAAILALAVTYYLGRIDVRLRNIEHAVSTTTTSVKR